MSKLSYLPRLDGLRGVAISAVLIEHFLSNRVIHGLSPGGFGVITFFVLSGYLITRILMQYRDRDTAVGAAAVQFYWRRLLRLSPPYYLAILVAAILGIAGMRSTWWIHALYLSNVKIALQSNWGGAAHFWSLSVEEQFYLFWFLIVVVLPRRFLAPAIVASIAVGTLYRLALFAVGADYFKVLLLPGCMDSLATGALIAYAAHSKRCAFVERLFLDWRMLAFSVLAALLVSWIKEWNSATKFLLYPIAITLLAGCAVRAAAESAKDWRMDWLSWFPLKYLGRISYGVYVYHLFVPDLIRLIAPGLDLWRLPGLVPFLILAGISIALASASWILVERPVLRLKNLPIRPRASRTPLYAKTAAD